MSSSNFRDVPRKAAGIALITGGVAVMLWGLLAAANLATFWWVYSSMSETLAGRGVDGNLSGLLGVCYAIFVVFIMDGLTILLIKGKRKQLALRVGSVMAVWFLAMYVATPFAGSVYDMWTGKPNAKYYEEDGKIYKVPVGAKTGPEGQVLHPFDSATAIRYRKQEQGKSSERNDERGVLDRFHDWVWPGDEAPIRATIENVILAADRTVVTIAVTRSDPSRVARFYGRHGMEYLTDEYGQTYTLLKEGAEYPDPVNADDHRPYTNGKVARTKAIRPDEVYRFAEEYEPLRENVKHLRFHDPRFGTVSIDYQLYLARKALARQQYEAELQRRELEKKAAEQEMARKLEEAAQQEEQPVSVSVPAGGQVPSVSRTDTPGELVTHLSSPANWGSMSQIERARYLCREYPTHLTVECRDAAAPYGGAEYVQKGSLEQSDSYRPSNWRSMSPRDQAKWLCREFPAKLTDDCRAAAYPFGRATKLMSE